VLLGRIRVYDELRAQIEKIIAAGIVPTHLDTHKHTHLMPQILDAVVRLSEEYGILWVRRPFDFPLTGNYGVPFPKKMLSASLRAVGKRFHSKLGEHGYRTTDHFAGFALTGRFRANELVSLIAELPEGTTEFMCHPGLCTSELRAAHTRLKESREEELRALTSSAVRDALRQCGVALVNYRQLA
jgi:predicted glycoside hydrolase/deacetylase ChbG (UPF0249 family)